jgi:hypothetical protein
VSRPFRALALSSTPLVEIFALIIFFMGAVVAERSNSYNSYIDWTVHDSRPRVRDSVDPSNYSLIIVRFVRGFEFAIVNPVLIVDLIRRLIYTAWVYGNPLFRGRLPTLSGHRRDHHHRLHLLDLSLIQIGRSYIDINCDLCDMFSM